MSLPTKIHNQPFGFSEYRYDEVSETYFAQAREYQPEYGRFAAKDVIKGDMTALVTLNQYGYCWGNPLAYVDKNGMQPEEEKDEALKWMENRGHSYWYTPQGLHEGNVALPLDSEKLRMSEQGKETLKGYELNVESGWNENIVVRDEVTNEVVAVYPYYVGDGGITFGIGHYTNFNEVMNDSDERELFTKYVSETIDPDIFDDGLGLKVKPRPVPNSKPVPLEEIEELFEKDVDGMAEDMLLNFENRNIMLTIQQLDALILIRFNTGYLGSDLTKLVEDGASREEWDKVITSQSRDRKRDAKAIYWGNIFTYKELKEGNCGE